MIISSESIPKGPSDVSSLGDIGGDVLGVVGVFDRETLILSTGNCVGKAGCV